MTTYTYIKINTKGNYVTLNEPLNENLYNLGSSYEDYLANKWVLLSDEQVTFHEEHPNATVYEVWNMEMTPTPERTIDDAKSNMIALIDAYDSSENVNGFTVNSTVSGWLTAAERSNYKSSIDAAKLLDIETLSFYIGDLLVSVSTTLAEQMLAQVQLYADQCFIVAKQHKAAVKALTSIEEIDAYDYTSGYPAKLNFDLE